MDTCLSAAAKTPENSSLPSDFNDIVLLRMLIEVLVRMDDSEEAKNDLLKLWETTYEDDDVEKSYIEKFKRDFIPSHAIQWYTTGCGLYKLLGQALRLMDFHDIVSLRMIIKYIYRQLNEEHQRFRINLNQEDSVIHSVLSGGGARGALLPQRSHAPNQVLGNLRFFAPDTLHLRPQKRRYGALSNYFRTFGNYFRTLGSKDLNKTLIIHVYRGRRMGNDEFEIWKTQVGQLKSISTVFSTSLSRDVALQFVQRERESSTRVPILLEIDIDTTLSLLPYAEVSHLSDFPEEKEVLLMFGSIYQINEIFYNTDEKVWITKMSLCGENDPRLEDMINYIKYEIKETTDLLTLAELFVKMGEYDIAKVYYNKYQNQLSNDNDNNQKKIKRASKGLSELYNIQGNYFIALSKYKEAYECFSEQFEICQKLPLNHPQYGKCYENMGNLCEIEKKNELALEYYQKALTIYHRSLPTYHPDITRIEYCIEQLMPKDTTEIAAPLTNASEFIEDSNAANNTVDNNNLESFLIVWLDANVTKTEDNLETLDKLRASVNYIKTFDDLLECKAYIQSIRREKIILIVSGSFCRQIVPQIHDLSQLNCIYIYCFNKSAHEEWSKQYSKVRSVIVKRNELVERVSEDQKLRNITEDSIPISVLKRTAITKETTAKDIAKEMGSILWFQLFIEVLLRMPHSDDAKNDLIQTWKDNYTGNSSELNIIDEFECKYTKEQAIYWYTRDSSLYRILNKALREQSIDIVLLFRFFMSDLSKQLSELYYNSLKDDNDGNNNQHIIHLYRGQAIAKEEFEQIESGIGNFISINSFFSTTSDEMVARKFAKGTNITEDKRRIMFRIEVDTRLPTKPFYNIEKFSYFQTEKEILFMFGCIFRINNVTNDDNDQLWLIDINLCSEDDFVLKEVFSYMKEDIGEETSMITLGNILIKMGEFNKAEEIFSKINYHDGLIETTESKGNYYLSMKDYQRAINYYKQVLSLRCQFYPDSHPDIGTSYFTIAMAYEFNKKYTDAIFYYNWAIKQYHRTLKDNHPLIIRTKNNLQKIDIVDL